MSNSSSSVFATRLASAASRLTPRLMLPDLTIDRALRGLLDLLVVLGRQAGGADDMHDARIRRERRKGDASRPGP